MGDKLVPFLVSLTVHLAVAVVITVSFSHSPQRPSTPRPAGQTVEAVAVDNAKVQQELERLRDRERSQQEHRSELQRKAEQARREREKEQQRIAALKRERAEEKKRREAEQQRLEKLKTEQAALARKKAELEKQRKTEQQRLAELEAKAKAEAEKRRREEEARRKAEAERKRLEAEKRRREEELKRLEAERERQRAEQALKEKLEAERQRLQSEHLKDLLARYKADIQNKVERNWLRPPGTAGTFSCKVLVSQLPGGDVAGVRLLESCGSPALDHSVENAVRKASPMPKPPDPALFDREIEFTFTTR